MLEEWTTTDPATRKKTGRVIEKKVGYFKKFNLDDFKQQPDLLERGSYVIQLED